MEVKKCTQCGITKNIDNFYKSKNTVKASCKKCSIKSKKARELTKPKSLKKPKAAKELETIFEFEAKLKKKAKITSEQYKEIEKERLKSCYKWLRIS